MSLPVEMEKPIKYTVQFLTLLFLIKVFSSIFFFVFLLSTKSAWSIMCLGRLKELSGSFHIQETL